MKKKNQNERIIKRNRNIKQHINTNFTLSINNRPFYYIIPHYNNAITIL